MTQLLWDWLGNLVAWVIFIAAVLAVYGLGRVHERRRWQPLRQWDREQVRVEVTDLLTPPTEVIPLQRGGES